MDKSCNLQGIELITYSLPRDFVSGTGVHFARRNDGVCQPGEERGGGIGRGGTENGVAITAVGGVEGGIEGGVREQQGALQFQELKMESIRGNAFIGQIPPGGCISQCHT